MISVGKIRDIFDGEGITEAYKSKSSVHGMEQTIELQKMKTLQVYALLIIPSMMQNVPDSVR